VVVAFTVGWLRAVALRGVAARRGVAPPPQRSCRNAAAVFAREQQAHSSDLGAATDTHRLNNFLRSSDRTQYNPTPVVGSPSPVLDTVKQGKGRNFVTF